MTGTLRGRTIITEALHKIDELSKRLEAAEKDGTEPIAVVGMGCRFPGGANNPDRYWQLLEQGRSAIVAVPPQRWDAEAYHSDDNSVPGTICSREGGFLTDWQPDEFDAAFFGISPREAAAMDPQQRLVLEVAWEALENAGITPQDIRGTKAAVLLGMTTNDYSLTFTGRLRPEDIDPYIPFGNAANFAAGRLAYFLGVRGPALVIDTACSSSLVAVHLACQSLRRRESETALAGGVNLMLSPENSIACSRWGMLAPDGRCKTFDAAADGYVRSEGCGVVVLKRLSDAVRDGNRVLAVVRGSAVNQDGASSGQTVPNGPAQQALLREALAASRLAPGDIDYIEAHGTGTALGDPIELDALSEVFGERDHPAPLVLGSVKTNLGHLESAAGIAGFIKTVLSVNRGYVPRHLNFQRLTPHAGQGASRFVIAAHGMEWPGVDRARRAGVSSFGVSGTNAHVVVEQALVTEAAAPQDDPAVCTLVVSGKTPERISSLAAAVADWMAGDGADVPLAQVAHALNHHRARYPKFATVCARDRDLAIAGLRAVAAVQAAAGVVGTHEGPCGSGTVFVYSGQGSQWAGMGRQLLLDEPTFAAAVADLEPVFVERVGFSLEKAIAGGELVTGDARVQPVIMGLQLALTDLWRSYGINPDAVIGHSMGEVTAAVVAGALTPAEGLHVIAIRSRLMSRLAGQGAVALLGLDAEDTAALVSGFPAVAVAGFVAPAQTVVAGPPAQVDAVIAAALRQDRLARRVNMEVASHTALMDPILPELRAALAELRPATPEIPLISTVIDAGTPSLDADYWVANVRRPVRLRQAVAAAGQNHTTFVEISPHPMLTRAITQTLGGTHHHSVGTLWRDGDDTLRFHTNLNAVHTTRPPHTAHPAGPHPVLPTTPWHHTRHWINFPDRDGPARATTDRRAVAATDVPTSRPDTIEGDVFLLGQDGDVVATLRGLRLQRMAGETPGPAEGMVGADVRDTLYEQRWQPAALDAPAGDAARPHEAATWLIFGDYSPGTEALCRLLEGQGQRCVLVEPGRDFAHLDSDTYRLDPARPEHFRRLLSDEFDGTQPPWRGVIHLWSWLAAAPSQTPTESLEEARTLGVTSVLHLVQALTRCAPPQPPRLWLVTRGAQSVGAGGNAAEDVSVAQATVWGMGRSIHHEHPELRCTRIDVAKGGDHDELDALVREVLADTPEGDVALRGDRRYVARLTRCGESGDSRPVEIRPDATYLVTGGLGGIGQAVARWLAERGARHLVLMGRHPASESARESLDALRANGTEVVVAQCDVARRDQLAAALSSVGASMPPLRGIVHAAGVIDDGVLAHLDARRLRDVMAPKVEGAWNLHELTQDAALEFFVLFSSAASLLGSPGQAHYAAANAFLDALAWHRRARGRPALSINWGPWAEVGLAAGPEQRRHLSRHGFAAMPPADGIRTLSDLLDSPATQVAVLRADWSRWHRPTRPELNPPLVADLLRVPAGEPLAGEAGGAGAGFREAVHRAAASERREMLESYLRDQVAAKLGLAPSRLDIQAPLNNLGVDSLTAMELRRTIQLDLGVVLPVVRLLDGPSVAALADWLRDELSQANSAQPERTATADTPATPAHAAAQPTDAAGPPWMDLLVHVPEVSDDDVDDLLRKLLAAKEDLDV